MPDTRSDARQRLAVEAAAYSWAAEPHVFVKRIIQSVEVHGELLTTTTTYDLDCGPAADRIRRLQRVAERPATDPDSGADDRWMLLPLVVLPRGELIDILDVDFTGEHLVVLTAAEGAPVAERWLRTLRRKALRDLPRLWFSDELIAEIEAALAPAVRAPRSSTQEVAASNVADAGRALLSLVPKQQHGVVLDACDSVLRWARFLAKHSYLWIRVPLDTGRATVTTRVVSHYEEKRPPDLRASVWGKVKRRVGLILGRRPANLSFEVPQAFSADTFHLTMRVPDQMHVHDCFLEKAAPPPVSGPDRGETHGDLGQPRYERWDPGAEYLLLSSSGSGVAHAYLRDMRIHPDVLDADNRPAVRVVVRLAEDLPGSRLPALVSAGFLAALSVVLACWLPRLLATGSVGGDLPTAVPVLLFSVPAVTAVWFRSTDAGDLLRRPLLSAISPLVVGGLSALLGIFYLLLTLADIDRTSPAIWAVWLTLTGGAVLWATVVLVHAVRHVRSELTTCQAEPRPSPRPAAPT